MTYAPSSDGPAKWWVGFAAAFMATWAVNRMENVYMIDFEQFGMSAGVFKGLLEGSFVSFFVWLTPSHLVESVTDGILFVKSAMKNWRDAWTKPN